MTTGHYIDYTDRTRSLGHIPVACSADPSFSHLHNGTFYNRLVISILQAAGMTPAMYENSAYNSSLVGITDPKYGSQNLGLTNIGGYGHAGKTVFGPYDFKGMASRMCFSIIGFSFSSSGL